MSLKCCVRSPLFFLLSIRAFGLIRFPLFLELVVSGVEEATLLINFRLLFLHDFLSLPQLLLVNLEFHWLLSSNYKLESHILPFQKTCNNARFL
jgi:hypothetical protein